MEDDEQNLLHGRGLGDGIACVLEIADKWSSEQGCWIGFSLSR